MPGAGQLTEEVRFERRAVDGNGDRLGDWGDDAFEVAAQATFLRGGEAVTEQRLQGNQPVVFTVYDSSRTRLLDNSWRGVHLKTGKAYNVKGVAPHRTQRAFLDVTALHDGTTGGV